ncbi:BTB/POZ domain protein, partial [Rhizoctonia solani AG-3 Rhs1AP]
MPKRRTTRNSSKLSSSSLSDISPKRTKTEEAHESDVEVIDDQADTTPEEQNKTVEDNSDDGLSRHADYYFEDGNIILCVDDTLFKVHKSLLKLQSNNFETVFGIPPVATGAGMLDQNPITLPNITVDQFCNLMKLIYHPFSYKKLLTPPGVSAGREDIGASFAFYSDIAASSHRFAMQDIEQWARPHLERILRSSGKLLALGVDAAFRRYNDQGNNGKESNLEDKGKYIEEEPSEVEVFYAFRLVEVISYARAISSTSMLNDSLSNKLWSHNLFTHMDRMALFSAQSYLTPLPDSLKTNAPLLFTKPVSSKALIKTFADNAVNYTCTERQCRVDMFTFWQESFDDKYYGHINSREFAVSMKALISLASRRLDFSCKVRGIKCSKECYEIVMLQLDGMIQGIHVQMAEYYKGFD